MSTSTAEDNTKKTIKFIAYLQVIGIILVVLGHSFHQYPDGAHGTTNIVYRIIYSFHMQMFVFISGFLMMLTSFGPGHTRSLRRFTIGKVKRLLVPFFVLTTITFIPRVMTNGMADDEITLTFESLLRSYIYSDALVIPFFWFIQALFILLVVNYLCLYLMERMRYGTTVYLLLAVSFFALIPMLDIEFTSIFAINRVAEMGIYFVLGMVFCQVYKKYGAVIAKANFLTVIAFAVAWILLFFCGKDLWIARLTALCGIGMCASICIVMERRGITILDHLTGANFLIFLISWYMNVAMQQVLGHFITLPWYVHTILSLVAGIYVPYLGYRYLMKHSASRWVKVAAFLLGQKMPKK